MSIISTEKVSHVSNNIYVQEAIIWFVIYDIYTMTAPSTLALVVRKVD